MVAMLGAAGAVGVVSTATVNQLIVLLSVSAP
jgi:hypothetical protein